VINTNWSYLGSFFPIIALHYISFFVLYCINVDFIVLFCCTVQYCLFSFLMFSLQATSSIKLNLNLDLNLYRFGVIAAYCSTFFVFEPPLGA